MSTILMYLKVNCPVGCEYCFELPSNIKDYDIQKMIKTLRQIYTPNDSICLHGGEICTVPIIDLENILIKVREIINNEKITIAAQTSLYGYTEEHKKLFQKYNVSLGISVDGPPELNILRGPRNQNKNEIYQKELQKNILDMVGERGHFGGISILSKVNGTGENLESLIKWALDNKFQGRFNPMFIPSWNNQAKNLVLTPNELKIAWLRLAKETITNPFLQWNPIREFINNLLGTSNPSPCVVNRCDYITTTCKTIMGDGTLARCDRCFQDGYFSRGINKNFVRSEMLKITECKGCRYFEICGGGCPGEGIDGDYRHKSYFCEAYYGLYEYLEKHLRGLFPNIILAVDIPDYYNVCETTGNRLNPFAKMMSIGQQNFNKDLSKINKRPLECKDEHGDHYDNNHYNINNETNQIEPLRTQNRPHGDHYDENFNDYNN